MYRETAEKKVKFTKSLIFMSKKGLKSFSFYDIIRKHGKLKLKR